MSKSTQTLALKTRTKTGTTSSNAVRHAGGVPGIIFGHGSTPAAVVIDAKAFDELLHAGGKNHLLEITIDGGKKDTVLIREVQRDPISRRVVHADLQRVSATEEITASLQLVTVGIAEGVKNAGGVMDVVLHAVDVAGPANALPESLEADVTALGLHEHLTAGDLKLPPKIKLVTDPAAILVSIESPRVELEPETTPAAEDVPTVAESENAESEAGA